VLLSLNYSGKKYTENLLYVSFSDSVFINKICHPLIGWHSNEVYSLSGKSKFYLRSQELNSMLINSKRRYSKAQMVALIIIRPMGIPSSGLTSPPLYLNFALLYSEIVISQICQFWWQILLPMWGENLGRNWLPFFSPCELKRETIWCMLHYFLVNWKLLKFYFLSHVPTCFYTLWMKFWHATTGLLFPTSL
jgi:hypothetical protein